MEKIIVAVGSKRRPKLNAVREALGVIGAALDPGAAFDVAGVEVESGVRHTPLSREELMRGARRRAEGLIQLVRNHAETWRYFVGLEGGLDVLHEDGRRRVFLESWAYVSDGAQGFFGCSGGIEMPEALAREVLEDGVELAEAIDRFAGTAGIRDAQGAWGVLSRDRITRQEAFRVAVVSAFAPFYNAKMYRAAGAAR
jgi:inosine/xanthosine triphosphatase